MACRRHCLSLLWLLLSSSRSLEFHSTWFFFKVMIETKRRKIPSDFFPGGVERTQSRCDSSPVVNGTLNGHNLNLFVFNRLQTPFIYHSKQLNWTPTVHRNLTGFIVCVCVCPFFCFFIRAWGNAVYHKHKWFNWNWNWCDCKLYPFTGYTALPREQWQFLFIFHFKKNVKHTKSTHGKRRIQWMEERKGEFNERRSEKDGFNGQKGKQRENLIVFIHCKLFGMLARFDLRRIRS